MVLDKPLSLACFGAHLLQNCLFIEEKSLSVQQLANQHPGFRLILYHLIYLVRDLSLVGHGCHSFLGQGGD